VSPIKCQCKPQTYKEASSKVLGGLDHAVLRLCTEDGKRAGLGEVVEEMAIQLPVCHSQHEVLAAAKRREQVGAQLVAPVAEERQIARESQPRLGRIAQFTCKLLRASPLGRVPRSVTVKQVHLGNLTTSGDQRAGLRQAIIGRVDRVPGCQIAPVPRNVTFGRSSLAAVIRLWLDQRERVGRATVVRVRLRRLNRRRFDAGGCRAREADYRLGREEAAVDLCC